MNEKQKQFADAYLTNGFNGYLAYISVYGVKQNRNSDEVSASRLLRKAKVKDYIAERQKELSQKTEIDFQWLVEQNLNVYNLALIQAKETVTGEIMSKPDLANANKALDQLTKLHGLYAPAKTENKNIIIDGIDEIKNYLSK